MGSARAVGQLGLLFSVVPSIAVRWSLTPGDPTAPPEGVPPFARHNLATSMTVRHPGQYNCIDQ